jgi:hypothetical protein
VLVEEGRVLVVLLLGILLQGVLRHPGIPLVVLPGEVLPIQMGFWAVRFVILVCLGGLLGLVLLLSIGPRHLH